ncbi:MAG TPA: c-type cytochrome [Candidatus Dormibacteraeota bacterium]|nr:c-type cytochrome [Candidatus Dormibacteraeota bacterium]
MTMRWIRSGLLMAGYAALMLATPARGADQISPAAEKEAQDIFKNRCTMCHGASGKGDGPAGVALNPKPRNWTDAAWQKDTPDEAIEKVILGGGQSVGKSVLMPANPDLANKPEVVKALRQIVRSFAGK